MPLYAEVVRAARETVSTILQGRLKFPIVLDLRTEGGETASVGLFGSTVKMNLPSLGADVFLTRGEADRIVALVAHECCHVLHTNWQAWGRATSLPKLKEMTNWIEDVRIEKTELKAGKLPGLLDLLSHMEAYDYYRAERARRAFGLPPCGSRYEDFGYVLATLGRTANGCTIPGSAALRGNVPAFARPVLDEALTRLRKLRDTHGAVDLARWVLAELHAAQQAALPPPPPPPPPPAPPKPEDKPEDKDGQSDDTDGDQDGQDDGQDDGQGDDTDGDQDGQDDGQDDGQGDDTDGQGDDGQGDDTDGQGDDGQKSTTWAASDGAGGLDPASTMQAMMDELKAREGVQADQAAQSVVMAWTGCESTPAPQPSPARGAALRSLMPAPAVLRDQITRLIRSDERHGTERYRSSGRLDRRALTRAARDGTNVFARRTFAPGVDTAILFLIDGSSSMSKGVFDPQTGTIMQHNGMRVSRMNLAQFLAQHLAEAADAARGKVCVCVFHGTENLGSLQEVKTFDRPLEVDVLATTSSYGYTPLSVSILGGAERLMNEQATRRILMVLTDGECDLGAERVKAAVKMTEARGVETVGIGCGTDVAYAFERFVNVMDMSRLAEDGLAALVDLLQPDDEAA